MKQKKWNIVLLLAAVVVIVIGVLQHQEGNIQSTPTVTSTAKPENTKEVTNTTKEPLRTKESTEAAGEEEISQTKTYVGEWSLAYEDINGKKKQKISQETQEEGYSYTFFADGTYSYYNVNDCTNGTYVIDEKNIAHLSPEEGEQEWEVWLNQKGELVTGGGESGDSTRSYYISIDNTSIVK